MRHYALQKIAGFLLTAILVSSITFFVLQILPGDPALLMLGTEGSPQVYARLRSEMNLNQPVLKRYLGWLLDFLSGQWGNSWRYSISVRELVFKAFPLSLTLALISVVTALFAAIPAGIFMAASPKSLLARIISVVSQVGLGLPQFWVGLLLIQLWAVRWGILPAGGQNLILPVVTLSLPRWAILSRFMRAGMVEALQQDYIRTAHAKGLSRSIVLFKHALRNGSLAVLTVAGLQFAQLLAGTIVVEQVFGLSGVGRLLLAGVFQRDLPLVQTVVMIIVILILIFDLIFDLSLGLLDPRIRYE